MYSHKLSFCRINKLGDRIAEVIVDEGVEVDMEMVAEYHRWIEENLEDPCGLLINKLHKYTYTFEAQTRIAELPMIRAMGVVAYSSVSEVTTKSLIRIPRESKWNIRIFPERGKALAWLEEELAAAAPAANRR